MKNAIVSITLLTFLSLLTSVHGKERGGKKSPSNVGSEVLTTHHVEQMQPLKETKKHKKVKQDIDEIDKRAMNRKKSKKSGKSGSTQTDKPSITDADSGQCFIVDINPGVVASFSDVMCNEWIPGSGQQSQLCVGEETMHGGAVCSLAAQCVLQEFKDIGIGLVIINSGTSQADIKAGLFSHGQFISTYPYHHDRMFALKMKGFQVLAALEEGLDTAATGKAPGAYPCGAGIRFSVDFDASKGNRLYNVEVKRLDQWLPINVIESYFVATNELLIVGGDGYTTFKTIEEVVNLNRPFYTVFSQCATDNCPFKSIPHSEYSTQNFVSRGRRVRNVHDHRGGTRPERALLLTIFSVCFRQLPVHIHSTLRTFNSVFLLSGAIGTQYSRLMRR